MNTTSIQTPEASTRRPVIITVLCVLGLIAAAANVPTIFAEVARKVGAWYPPFLTLSVVVTVVCVIGLWKMRRWAVLLYTGFALAVLVIALMIGAWNTTAQLVRFAVIIIMFSQFPKMR
jgi:hypothetical protein